MSTAKTLRIVSTSSEATYTLGERLGKVCRGGEVFVLASDLGGGKTVLAKGLAAGCGSDDDVTSPTFTVMNEYRAGNTRFIHHYDFYRLNDPGVLQYELAESVGDESIVSIVEWGDIVSEQLPEDAVVIRLERVAGDENARDITLKVSENKIYLTEAIQ